MATVDSSKSAPPKPVDLKQIKEQLRKQANSIRVQAGGRAFEIAVWANKIDALAINLPVHWRINAVTGTHQAGTQK